MSELIAKDSDGSEHFVWIQEKEDTCGPARIYMIQRLKSRSSNRGGEERIKFLTTLLPDGYREGQGTQHFKALASVLNRIGIPATSSVQANVKDYLRVGAFPVIARIGWPNGNGHFVVCVKFIKNDELVCMDPYYGLTQQSSGVCPHTQSARIIEPTPRSL